MSGRRLERLARMGNGLIITEDVPVVFVDTGTSYSQYSQYTSKQLWAYEIGRQCTLVRDSRPMPAIAIVDSGIDTNLPDFAGRNISSSASSARSKPNGALDGRGHGSFVAGIAAGSARDYAGVAPNAPIVSLDVMDDSGSGRTSDVIAATEWILKNHVANDIKVVNYSLHGGGTSHFYDDPLNKAVSKLWFAGITVVAAAGNYGKDGGPSGVLFAPGNNPFVITVGAVDIGGTARTYDDDRAPWSAYGRTQDGFWKPEICAPGRMMVGPIPMGSTLAVEKASKIKSPGYVELSGTSFAAPVISGIAAQILARNPNMTPDQVKGAIMRRARDVPRAENELVRRRAGQCCQGSVQRNEYIEPECRARTASCRRMRRRGRRSSTRSAGRTSPGPTSRGTRSPGRTCPGATSPGMRSPGAMSPGRTSPGAMCSWSDVSWEDAGNDVGTPDGSGIPLTPEQQLAAASDPDLAPSARPAVAGRPLWWRRSRLQRRRRSRPMTAPAAVVSRPGTSTRAAVLRPASSLTVSPIRGNSNGGTPRGGCPSARVGIPFETATSRLRFCGIEGDQRHEKHVRSGRMNAILSKTRSPAVARRSRRAASSRPRPFSTSSPSRPARSR